MNFVGYNKLPFHERYVCVAVSVVLGIPTVRREVQSYLLATLQNLIESMNEEEAADSLIVIFIAEVPRFKTKSFYFK
jgi:N-Acetylglucosaminyltransferase-IV (GnT-IV) conserved region.